MKFPFLLFALVSSIALAAPDCTTLVADTNGYLGYKEMAVFPNTPKVTEYHLDAAKKPIKASACGLTVTADGRQYTFQAKDPLTLFKLLGNGMALNFTLIGEVESGGKKLYTDAAMVTLVLPNGLLSNDARITGYRKGSFLPIDALMAVRVDQGKLLPLFYQNNFQDLNVNPNAALIQFFLKSKKTLHWERMDFDIRQAKLTFYRKATFPAK